MRRRGKPIEIVCDAPPYPIVRACRDVGFGSPEDVRWCRPSRLLEARDVWRRCFVGDAWKLLAAAVAVGAEACTCGGVLPGLEGYTFTLNNGDQLSYYLGQCDRCHTVFWEEA